ncbi:hypothetical protein K469DRAFT_671979 [Zopfia rhizophila CBS 207.26]|uniref:Rhodopsin domain-containing protein n=1 Tax=Zopfia rhizophila CBS 207.26 TaxID=1314779 RepID=A0A6A6DNA0_9PEZI|nr:hypothetical protein K469DRAFT_671979 [Zopfia rhizophila CBS 207.26]
MPPFDPSTPSELPQTTDAQEENAAKIILFTAVFLVLTFAAIALRLASRWIQGVRLRWDDILLLLSFAQMLAIHVLFVVAIKYGGFGRHTSQITDEQLVFFMKSYFAAGLVMPTCYATAKLSILALLYRMFALSKFRTVVRILTAVVLCWWVSTVLLDTFICYPINARWDSSIKGNCSNKVIQVEYFATPIPWIITDFGILIAPMPVLGSMKLSRAKKVAIFAMFGFGVVTCAVACKRYITLLQIHNDDITFSMVEPCIWTIVETSTTIICASLPGSLHALKKVLPTILLRQSFEYIEEWFYAWKTSSTQWWSTGRRATQTVCETVESPPASISTRRLELTPI